MESFYLEQSA